MESTTVVAALAALAHENRLAIYRLLVQAGPPGLTVGDLQARTGLPPATLTHHLNALRRAGLVVDSRDGRSITCRADYARMNALLAYLTENCCGDQGSCAPVSVCQPPRPGRRTHR